MPLVRFGLKNEYGLGVEELYKDGVLSEDPKAVLDGVAVAGLVGVLRQLGDLAQFAAEVFHGLQEQVASTSSRSRKLVNRVQRIEASLPSLEKAILSQTDHLRFAYAPGSKWHACIRDERHHFICDDLPHYIMDSYEECREPPRLQLLDRFDSGGPGSCLQRYSDPTFFRRASSCSEVSISEKSQRERKARKIKKRSWQQSGQFPKSAPQVLNGSGRMQHSSTGQGQSSMSHTGSTFDMAFKSDLGDQSDSHGSKDGVDFVDCISRPSISIQPDETKNKRFSSSVTEAEVNTDEPIYLDEQTAVASDDKLCSPPVEAIIPPSSTWDEKLEIIDRTDINYGIEDVRQLPVNDANVNQVNDFFEQNSTVVSEADAWYLSTSSDGNTTEPTRFNSGTNEAQDHLKKKTNFDLQGHNLEPADIKSWTQVVDLSEGVKTPEPTTNGNVVNNSAYRRLGTGEGEYFNESNFDVAEKELEAFNFEHVSTVDASTGGDNRVKAIEWNQHQSEAVNAVSQVDAFFEGQNSVNVIEWNQRDLETVNPEHVSEEDAFSEGVNIVEVIEWNHLERETTNAEHCSQVDSFSEGGTGYHMKLIKWSQQELETQIAQDAGRVDTSTDAGNSLQVIKWNQHEDIDSGTENFVDALNTIESESESDFETDMKREVQGRVYGDEIGEDAIDGQNAEIISHLVSECQCPSTSDNFQEGGSEDLERLTTLSSADMWSLDRTQSSHDKSESAAGQNLDISTCLSNEQSMQNSQSSSIYNVSQALDISANEPEIRVDPAACEITKPGSEAPDDERVTSASHVSEKKSAGLSSTYPPAFWTNGTLFGLQPSKPTVFSMPNSVDSAPTSNSNKVGQCGLDALQKVDVPAGNLASSVNESEHCQDVSSCKRLSHQRLEKTYDSSAGHDKSNSNDRPLILGLSNNVVMPIESKVPIDTSVKNISSEATVASEDRSSLLSMLSRGLLKNGLRRSGSLGYDEKRESSSPSKMNDFDDRCQNAVSHSVPETNLEGKLNSPVNSPPLSPPLEHMKISFQPVDGFDTSRLKLKYPEGVDHSENTLDAFPSFQLVPESTKLQHDIGSDSDDDTFCRSYACMSDESHSHQSDSNSEQWESGDTTESNDHTLYTGLQRISSAESAASVSPQHEEADRGNISVGSRSVSDTHSLSDPSSGLQIVDAKNPFAYQEMKLCLNPGVDTSHLQEAIHELPPLPPLQWRASRPMFNGIQDNPDQGFDSLSQSFVPKLLNTGTAHPSKVDLSKLISTTQESATNAIPKKVEDQQFGQEQSYHAEKEQTMDDKGDFLQQIRTKSFNLKRTEPTQSTFTPTPATSYKVTAILQKANAIRKAVGSDDGEDDSWSDT